MNKRVLMILFLSLTAVGLLSQSGLFSRQTLEAASPAVEQMQRFLENRQPVTEEIVAAPAAACVGGMAGTFPCNNVDLLAHIPLSAMGATAGNTGWGWTDPDDGTEYAIMGLNNGTAFFDISDPENPLYLGKLPTHTGSSSWREFKVAGNYVYIVSDSNPGHGMQVFDLTELRDVTSPPVTFTASAHYPGVAGNMVGSAHNVATNPETNTVIIMGAPGTCSSGLHLVDVANPLAPTFAGCFSADGYTHDAQCIIYQGPDTTHVGKDICLNSNEDTLTIVDISNRAAPAQLSRTPYAGSGYTHQGWLTADMHYFLVNDELDEWNFGHNARTYIWDVSDLDAPQLIGTFTSSAPAIDHNLYIDGNLVYESNYTSGLRILDISDVANANLEEVAFFDTYPPNDNPTFNGTWNNYPYFESGVVVISDIDRGMFLVRPTLSTAGVALTAVDDSLVGLPGDSVTYDITIENTGADADTFDLSVAGESWTTTLSQPSITLDAGDSSSFQVTVDIPADVFGAAQDEATITAVSSNDPVISSNVNLTTVADSVLGFVATTDQDTLAGAPETDLVYTVQLTNTGNITDTYLITTSSLWASAASAADITLAPDATGTFTVTITVPADALDGDSDMAMVMVTSQQDSSLMEHINLTAIAEVEDPTYTVYLPVLLRP